MVIMPARPFLERCHHRKPQHRQHRHPQKPLPWFPSGHKRLRRKARAQRQRDSHASIERRARYGSRSAHGACRGKRSRRSKLIYDDAHILHRRLTAAHDLDRASACHLGNGGIKKLRARKVVRKGRIIRRIDIRAAEGIYRRNNLAVQILFPAGLCLERGLLVDFGLNSRKHFLYHRFGIHARRKPRKTLA